METESVSIRTKKNIKTTNEHIYTYVHTYILVDVPNKLEILTVPYVLISKV